MQPCRIAGLASLEGNGVDVNGREQTERQSPILIVFRCVGVTLYRRPDLVYQEEGYMNENKTIVACAGVGFRRRWSIDTTPGSLNDIDDEHENLTDCIRYRNVLRSPQPGRRVYRVTRLLIERRLAIRCGESAGGAVPLLRQGSARGACGTTPVARRRGGNGRPRWGEQGADLGAAKEAPQFSHCNPGTGIINTTATLDG